jgi:hypothetical protein
MSEFDFLKSFGEQLGNQRGYEPEDGEWDKVAAAIDQTALRARWYRFGGKLFGAAAILAVFLLLGWSWLCAFYKIERLEKQVYHLQAKLNTAAPVSKEKTGHSAQSVVIQKTHIEYDTIYRTIVVDLLGSSTLSTGWQKNMGKSFFQIAPYPTQSVPEIADKTVFENQNQIGSPPATTNFFEKKEPGITEAPKSAETNKVNAPVEVLSEEKTLKLPIDSLRQKPFLTEPELPSSIPPFLKIAPAVIPESEDPIATVTNAPAIQHSIAKAPKPLIFAVGYTGGILFSTSENLSEFNAFSTGVQTEVGWGSHFRIRGSAEYLSSHYTIDRYGRHDGYIPPLPPVNKLDELHYVNGQQILWNFTLGSRYLFSIGKKQRGFVSAAWLNEQAGEQLLQYEFKDPATGEETHLIKEQHDAKFTNQCIQLGAGLEWTLWRGLSLQTEAIYQRQLPVKIPLLAERIGLKVGLLYRF